MDALAAVFRHPDDGGFTHTRNLINSALDILGKYIQTVSGDDHLLLPSAYRKAAGFVETADVSGMKPATLKRLRRFGVGVQIAGRYVVAADQDLSVVRDLDLNSGDRLPDAALPRMKRMVQSDDGR